MNFGRASAMFLRCSIGHINIAPCLLYSKRVFNYTSNRGTKKIMLNSLLDGSESIVWRTEYSIMSVEFVIQSSLFVCFARFVLLAFFDKILGEKLCKWSGALSFRRRRSVDTWSCFNRQKAKNLLSFFYFRSSLGRLLRWKPSSSTKPLEVFFLLT